MKIAGVSLIALIGVSFLPVSKRFEIASAFSSQCNHTLRINILTSREITLRVFSKRQTIRACLEEACL